MFRLGDTFLAGEGVHGKHHLWIVVNNPAQHGDTALFINVTTLSEIAETTCVLQPGEHPLVTRPSWIRFASAKSALVGELDTLESRGLIVRKPPASIALVTKIRAGAAASPRLPEKFRGLL